MSSGQNYNVRKPCYDRYVDRKKGPPGHEWNGKISTSIGGKNMKKYTLDREVACQDEYNDTCARAQAETWEIARRLIRNPEDGGYTADELVEIFGTVDIDHIILNLDASEIGSLLDDYDMIHGRTYLPATLPEEGKMQLQAMLEALRRMYGVSMDAILVDVAKLAAA